jgi:hypothetical protein
MPDKKMVIPKGALFSVTSGYYSDFTVQGVFRAKEDIDCDALAKEWMSQWQAEHKNDTWMSPNYHFREGEFLMWVTAKGLLESVDSFTWHLGEVDNEGAPIHDLTDQRRT